MSPVVGATGVDDGYIRRKVAHPGEIPGRDAGFVTKC